MSFDDIEIEGLLE